MADGFATTIASSGELIRRLHALGDDNGDLVLPDVTGPSDLRPTNRRRRYELAHFDVGIESMEVWLRALARASSAIGISAKTLGDKTDGPSAADYQQWVDDANAVWADMDGLLAATQTIVGNHRHADEVNLRMWQGR